MNLEVPAVNPARQGAFYLCFLVFKSAFAEKRAVPSVGPRAQ